jgi:hypothetical protein
MKWFKHMSDASNDSFMEELEDKFGWEGFGRWWKLLEIIATKMDETDLCSAEHSWVKWQSFLKGKRNKLELFLSHCQDKGKIKLEQNGNILKISCPKLLELRDEYSRKSGHKQDKGQDKLPAKNKEERIKIEDKNISPNSGNSDDLFSEIPKPQEKPKPKVSKYTPEFEEFWDTWIKDRRIGKPGALAAYKIAVKKIPHSDLIASVRCYTQKEQGKPNYSPEYIPYPARWLKEERWLGFSQEAHAPQAQRVVLETNPTMLKVYDHLRKSLGEATFFSWFSRVTLSHDDGRVLRLMAPMRFLIDTIERAYAHHLNAAVTEVLGEREIVFEMMEATR